MKKNGKRFEENFQKSCKEQGIFCYRLKDSGSSFQKADNLRFTSSNMCDYITFNGSLLLNIELKCHKGKSLPFDCIREKQNTMLIESSKYKNVVCGLLVNFSDVEECYFLNIIDYNVFLENTDRKSIPLDYFKQKGINVKLERKKVNFIYDVGGLFERIE